MIGSETTPPSRRAVPHRRHLVMLLLALAVLALTLASVAIGYAPFDVPAALADLAAGRTTLPALVLWELRIPRALLGGLVGFSLGLTGAAMQGYLRNPLADPGILGISSAAALGAVLVFYSGLAASMSLALPLGGVAGPPSPPPFWGRSPPGAAVRWD